MSTLMFWNKQNGHDNKNGKKNWLHAPDNLVDGHIVYRAKVRKELSLDKTSLLLFIVITDKS